MKKLFMGLGLVLVLLATFGTPVLADSFVKPDILEIIELKGEIFGASGLESVVEKINENPKIKSVLLVIDSPGGGVLATKTIYDLLGQIKVPITVWCDNVCASGGLYVAMAPSVKRIIVRDVTITGSMGVLTTGLQFNRLLDWAKLDPWTFKSGELKDSGNSTRPMTESDRKYIQGIVDYLASQFYGIVRKARPGISDSDFETLKSARIVFGEQAVTMKLADLAGDRKLAVSEAKKLSGSKLIMTREEMRKMGRVAEDGPVGGFGFRQPHRETLEGDIHWLVEQLKEIRAGGQLSFEYRLPWRF